MNDNQGAETLRRANPLFTLVIGVLIGALLVAIADQPPKTRSVTTAGAGRAAGSAPGAASGVVGPGGAESAVPDASGAATSDTAARAGSGAGAASAVSGGSSGGSTSGRPAAAGGAAAASAAAGGCTGALSKGVQGVTNNSVKIGFALPDLGVLAAAIPIGDQQAHIQAVLAGMRKAKLLPVCGRDITPVFRKFNVLDPSQSRAACVALADEEKVFGVISLFGFSGAECVTVEKKRFLLDAGNALRNQDYAASSLLFSEDPPLEPAMAAMTYWAIRSGILNGKSIGVYYNTHGPGGTTPPGDVVKRNLIDILTRAGHPPKVVVASDTSLSSANVSQGDPNDSVAVQRFKAANVQVVFPMNWVANFFNQAQLQGYKAQWVGYGVAMVSDATTSTFPADTFDGATGLTFDHTGEDASGLPMTAEQRTCLAYWAAAGHPTPKRDANEALTIREACDPIDLLLRGMRTAGNNLTPPTLVAGMETIRNVPMAYYADQTFSPGKHYGASTNIAQRWSKACTCWKVTGPWSPLYKS